MEENLEEASEMHHPGEYRKGKRFCCALPNNESSEDGSVLCVHTGGIVQGNHWSCCGKKSVTAAPCTAGGSSGAQDAGATPTASATRKTAFSGNLTKVPLCLQRALATVTSEAHAVSGSASGGSSGSSSSLDVWPYDGATAATGVAEVSSIRRGMEDSIWKGRALLTTADAVKCAQLTFLDMTLTEKSAATSDARKRAMNGMAADQISRILSLFRGGADSIRDGRQALKPGVAIIGNASSLSAKLK